MVQCAGAACMAVPAGSALPPILKQVRASVPKMTLDEVFLNKETIAKDIKDVRTFSRRQLDVMWQDQMLEHLNHAMTILASLSIGADQEHEHVWLHHHRCPGQRYRTREQGQGCHERVRAACLGSGTVDSSACSDV